jgi:hypothetical protein
MRHLSRSDMTLEKVSAFQADAELNKEWLLVSPDNDMWSFSSIEKIKEFLNDETICKRSAVGS